MRVLTLRRAFDDHTIAYAEDLARRADLLNECKAAGIEGLRAEAKQGMTGRIISSQRASN